MQIWIEAGDLPGRSCGPSPDAPDGYPNVHVGVQRRNRRDELLGLVAGDAAGAQWVLDCEAARTADGLDLRGPHIQGPPGKRFIYLSWGSVDGTGFHLFRRAKLLLGAVPANGPRADEPADASAAEGRRSAVGSHDDAVSFA